MRAGASLYDALYGTDALGDLPQGRGYDAARGARVIAWAQGALDEAVPLAAGSHGRCDRAITVEDGALAWPATARWPIRRNSSGYRGTGGARAICACATTGCMSSCVFDPHHRDRRATIRRASADVRLEAALTTIMDCEDSVACVDAEDKVLAYGNWLGLMKGDLEETFEKGGQTLTRALNPDCAYHRARRRRRLTLKGRVADAGAQCRPSDDQPRRAGRARASEVPEGLMDAMSPC